MDQSRILNPSQSQNRIIIIIMEKKAREVHRDIEAIEEQTARRGYQAHAEPLGPPGQQGRKARQA
jgi:hypothetical protein